MKPEIHPQYLPTIFKCGCGVVYNTFSTLGGEHHVEICAQCHPFFKGDKGGKLVDAAGRIDKFNRRYQRT